MVKDHSGNERGDPLPLLYGLFFPINSKGSFIYIIPQTYFSFQLEYHNWCYKVFGSVTSVGWCI